MADFAAAVAITLVNEGGGRIANNPADKGGVTRWGITTASLSAFRKKAVSDSDVRMLTEAEAKTIYQANYWTPLRCSEIGSQAVASAVFDAGVLTGTANAARTVQAAVGATVDGQIGPKTIAAINGADTNTTLRAFSGALQQYLVRIVQRDSSQAVFLCGWLKRAAVSQALPFLLA